ncbi:protein of unknown function [Candidatus Nitrotoga arctica]|uniref:Uncharacterized protein n=1 Tax=Candidatus Nitrotoga arctica TaxID=453162 RepID=A0ABN8AR02_9PROT|nr:protein of unknown function [Candidatus Nitrotoga arctica]
MHFMDGQFSDLFEQTAEGEM